MSHLPEIKVESCAWVLRWWGYSHCPPVVWVYSVQRARDIRGEEGIWRETTDDICKRSAQLKTVDIIMIKGGTTTQNKAQSLACSSPLCLLGHWCNPPLTGSCPTESLWWMDDLLLRWSLNFFFFNPSPSASVWSNLSLSTFINRLK